MYFFVKMREEQLLDRIRLQAKEPARRVTEDPKRVVHSIRDHLERILNTRKGSVGIADDYGISDFSLIMDGHPDSLRDFARATQQTIQKYEPRLKAVRVEFIHREEGSFSVSFKIIARLAAAPKKDPIVFRSLLYSDGKISIR